MMDDQEFSTNNIIQQTSSQLSASSAGSSDALVDGCIPQGYGSIRIPQYITIELPCDDDGVVCASKRYCVKFSIVLSLILLGGMAFSSYLPAAQNSIDTQLLGSQRIFHKKEEYQQPLYYNDQLVDHFAKDTKQTWSNRYYVSSKHFQGPGSPLLVVMGGEGAVDEILYPFVMNDLASQFGAYVLQTEHRFYGVSFPTKAGKRSLPTNHELKTLLSPDQALADAARLIRRIQGDIGCSIDRSSPEYCPVITVGASYPGFLSAMMRFVYPDVVDVGYASSAPIKLYSRQNTDPEVYFNHVTNVAEGASPGCAKAYKSTLTEAYDLMKNMPIDEAAKALKICNDRIPKYITSPELFAYEITNMVGFANADFNMEYHPPGDSSTDLIRSCKAFAQKKKTPLERMADFFAIKAETAEAPGARYAKCSDLHWDLPSGPNSTLTGSDWTGVGYGMSGNSWEYQCCKDLIVTAGFGSQSMFLERPFDVDWLTQHCQSRFQIEPDPHRMVHQWHFDDLVGQGASYILFTNGNNDAWSRVSQTESLSDTLVALNFPSGAHHSELNTVRPDQQESPDIVEGRKTIATILGQFIDDVKLQALGDE